MTKYIYINKSMACVFFSKMARVGKKNIFMRLCLLTVHKKSAYGLSAYA